MKKGNKIIMQIYLLLTENCNLSCAMCIRGKQNGTLLDFQAIDMIKDQFTGHDVVLTGGEPTLHTNFVQIADLMSDVSHTLTITTNGTNFDKLLSVSKLKKENVLFQISLDGTKEYHDSIRGKGTYDKTFLTIKKLDELNVPYCIATVASKKNLNCMSELITILQTLKNMKYWRISYEMPFGSAQINDMMTADEWNVFVDKMLTEVHFRMKIQKIFPFDLYDRMIANGKIRNSTYRGVNCGSGKNKIYIYPDLKVYPCTCLTDFCIGDLSQNSISEMLASAQAKTFSDYQLIDGTPCQQCEYKSYCNGGCIGMSYRFFGKFGYGDVRCPKLTEYYKKFKGESLK
jgi:radical SAM protein with 4Fe4S-binding SPASM domain